METIVEQMFEPVPEDEEDSVLSRPSEAKPWQILQAVWNNTEEEMRERDMRNALAKIQN